MDRNRAFTRDLLAWYRCCGRHDLPWRQDITPYRVWISEIMLQQTQVNRVAELYFPRFIERYPDLKRLAAATWDDVYPLWQGLGYYRRGQNLLRAAKILSEQHNGEIPRDIQLLENLPGVGAYTARAILSFAFDEKVPAVDTNLRKIIKHLWPRACPHRKAAQLICFASSGRDWNNAMMDLGTALREGQKLSAPLDTWFPPDQAEKFLPLRTKNPRAPRKKNRKRVEVGVGCIWQDGKYLIQSRPDNKSFPGKWEFPGGKREKGEDFRACVKRELQEELGIEVSVRPHFFETCLVFDRVELLLRFHRCQIQAGEPKALEGQTLRWVRPRHFDTVDFLRTNAEALQKLKRMRV